MTDYIAFLRGINISGKNKVPMAELKTLFEQLGFGGVKTLLNSGNVCFASDDGNTDAVCNKIKSALGSQFDFEIPVVVIKKSELEDITANAPKWWGTEDKAYYHNLIFLMQGTAVEEVQKACGEPKAEIEKIQCYKNVIFWTYTLKDYQKSTWWKKTATTEIKDSITIRTAGTVKKVLGV